VDVTINRTSGDECIPPSQETAFASFTVEVALTDPDARAGEVWFLSVFCQEIVFTGTIAHGGMQSFGFTTRAAAPGAQIPLVARVHLPNVGISGTGTATADIPAVCDPEAGGCMDPEANNYDPLATWDDGSCTYDPCEGPSITDPPGGTDTLNVMENDPVMLSVTASGTAPLSYSWTKDGGPEIGTSSTLDLGLIELGEAGVYTCAVSNGCGNANAVFTVNVTPS
jgi:hypothetical protein